MCFPLMMSVLFGEGEEAVAVVLVLLATSLDLSGEAGGQVVDESIKLIEFLDDPILLSGRRCRYLDFRKPVEQKSLHLRSSDVLCLLASKPVGPHHIGNECRVQSAAERVTVVVNSNRLVSDPGYAATDIGNHFSDVNENHVSRLSEAKFRAK